jgi:guanylate kinase
MKKYKIIALFGKSGAGKDTIQKWIMKHFSRKCNSIVSCTTRPPRQGEKNGQDYFFLTNEQFAEKVLNLSMLEATEFRGWYYGTSIDQLDPDKINVGVFNIAGIEALLEDRRLEVFPVLVDAKDKTRLLRALNREDNPDCAEICRRFKTDADDFAQMDFEPKFIWDNNNDKKKLFRLAWRALEKALPETWTE